MSKAPARTASMRRVLALALLFATGAHCALPAPLPALVAYLRALPRTYERVLLRSETNLTRAEEAQTVRVENLWLF